MRKSVVALAAFVGLGWFGAAMLFGSSSAQTRMTLSKADVTAPPEALFALVEDFRLWSRWSPHEKADPAVHRGFSGSAKGKGAVYDWDGPGEAGKGRASITDASAPGRIAVEVDLTKPLAGA